MSIGQKPFMERRQNWRCSKCGATVTKKVAAGPPSPGNCPKFSHRPGVKGPHLWGRIGGAY